MGTWQSCWLNHSSVHRSQGSSCCEGPWGSACPKDELGEMGGCGETLAESRHGAAGHLQPPPLSLKLQAGLQARLLPQGLGDHLVYLLSNGQTLPPLDLPAGTHLWKSSKDKKKLVIKGIEVKRVTGTSEGLETISRAVVLADWMGAAKLWGTSDPSSAQAVCGPRCPFQGY